jgi:hypothetical protein
MQTFFPYTSVYDSVVVLDDRRLMKQRVEAIQIAICLLEKESRWKNHPAVKMWKGYEPYLVRRYLFFLLTESKLRGFKNTKSLIHYERLLNKVIDKEIVKPHWIDDDFCRRHQSNLLRKNKEYYGQFFKGIPDNLEYRWS